VIQIMEDLHQSARLSWRRQCELLGIAYSSLMRWKGRLHRKEPVLKRPGPKKVGILDYDTLAQRLEALRHGQKRSYGVGSLIRDFGDALSRRGIGLVVQCCRQRAHRAEAESMRRIAWLMARMVWAMDDAMWLDPSGGTWFFHNIQDLGSRFKFRPVVSSQLIDGEHICANLRHLIHLYGAPLFLKRDGGSNLNHHVVDQLLAEQCIIPIDSPPGYPQFNGGIERAQRDWKKGIRINDLLGKEPAMSQAGLQTCLERITEQLNHQPRRCLAGKIPCMAFFDSPPLRYSRRQRMEIFLWIAQEAEYLWEVTPYPRNPNHAWRLAAEQWLLLAGAIKFTQNPRVLPLFYGQSLP
jgi:transposase InsO family protein